MKSLNGSVLRCIFAIVLGLVLVLWPEAAITYLVVTIGICFILPGIFTLLNYFTRERVEGEPSPMFPIDGAGSILFGAWLVIMPQFFVSILMYILGALLVLGGVQQIVSLVSARKWSVVPFAFYIVPILILITGIMILAYPFGAAANTFVIFGVASLIYGISELINWYKFRKR
ncbi:HdeD family acid-resistance protein [Parabacteroides sp. APC149_11_2_Y6]